LHARIRYVEVLRESRVMVIVPMARKILLILPLLALIVGCNRNPEEAERKLINTGNKYFKNERYREA